MEAMKTKEILNILITDWGYEQFCYPYFFRGYTYSTNGSCLLRVKGQFVENKEGYKFPNIDFIDFGAINGDGVSVDIGGHKIKYPYCCSCSLTSKIEPTVCNECEGTGFVEFDSGFNVYENECESCNGHRVQGLWPTKDCPECHGTRFSIHEKIKIGNRNFNMIIVAWLHKKVENLRFYPGSNVCKDAIGFKFDGGVGALMRLRE